MPEPRTAPAPPPTAVVVLPADVWRAHARAHRERIARRTDPLVALRMRGEKHPVQDFLFGYYTHSPAALQRWHPGPGVLLADDDGAAARAEAAELGTTPRGEWKHYRRVEAGEVAGAVVDGRPVGGWLVDVAAVLADRASGVAFTRDLLARTVERTPRLGCFGLHEWAMAYRSDVHGVRHSQLPLRLGAEGTDAVVEGSRIRCTHFDAFRFFAPEARDRNEGDDGVLPTRAGMREMEQPGCLHAGMDLYKSTPRRIIPCAPPCTSASHSTATAMAWPWIANNRTVNVSLRRADGSWWRRTRTTASPRRTLRKLGPRTTGWWTTGSGAGLTPWSAGTSTA